MEKIYRTFNIPVPFPHRSLTVLGLKIKNEMTYFSIIIKNKLIVTVTVSVTVKKFQGKFTVTVTVLRNVHGKGSRNLFFIIIVNFHDHGNGKDYFIFVLFIPV